MQTRSQARSSGIKLPEVHCVGKNLDPNIEPEKQHANPIKGSIEKPHICVYCVPEFMIMDQDSTFMSSLMMYLLNKFNIKIRTVAHIIINLFKLNMVSNLYQPF